MRSGSQSPLLSQILRRVAQAAFAGALGCALAAPAAAAPKTELKALRGRIQSLQKDLDSAEASRIKGAAALRQAERAISDINRRLHRLNLRQSQVRRTLRRLQRQSARTRKDIRAQRQRLGALLYQQYLDGGESPLVLLLNRQDPNQIAREFQYYGYVSRARADLVRELGRNLKRVRVLVDETRQKNIELAHIQGQQAAQKRRLQRERGSRKEVLAHLSKRIKSQRHEIGRLQRDAKRLTALVKRLGKLAAEKRMRHGLRNRRLPQASFAGIPFPKLKGRLHLPLTGELVDRFGSPRRETGIPWKGVFIRARTGQPVRAIASGRVVFAARLRGFGNLIILDHGGGYMSLYADNESLDKQVGDKVRAGETIATVGNSGVKQESGLYFEMRYHSKPFDPLTWITLK